MPRGMTMAEADALALGLDPDKMTGEELIALHAEQQAKRETALLADPMHEDTATRFWRSHRDPFEALDGSRQHVIIDNDKPGVFVVSGNCPDVEFSTFVEDMPVMGKRIGLNKHGNTVYERMDTSVLA